MDIDSRIRSILGDDCRRSLQNASVYMKYLKRTIALPCQLKGVEAFIVEDDSSYRPHSTDVFDLVKLLEPDPTTFDVIARVRRLTDMSVFDIDLSWLKCVDPDDANSQLVEDYGHWSVNY